MSQGCRRGDNRPGRGSDESAQAVPVESAFDTDADMGKRISNMSFKCARQKR